MKQNLEHPTLTKRPSNTVLVLSALFKCIMSGFTGTVIAAALCMFNDRLPFENLSLTFIAASTVVGFVVFFATHFPDAKKHRAAFIAAGGNPDGINLFMFGAMPSHRV